MRPFSIYFPQFYPIKTNDQAWGDGFTDWALVANANMRNQWDRRAPQRGFYDGSSPSVHRSHIEEMKYFGLGGFAVYHYWFYTHQELGAFEGTILRERPELPWFMIWASEGWSKRWLGDPTTLVSLSKTPSDAEIDTHCDYLSTCFESPDYFKINGRPLFVFYNLSHFTSPEQVLSKYKNSILKRGHDVCFGHFIKNPSDVIYSKLVDVNYLFEPRLFFGIQSAARGSFAKRIHDFLARTVSNSIMSRLMLLADKVTPKGREYSSDLFTSYLQTDRRVDLVRALPGQVQEVLSPGWNNTPRYSERFTAMGSIEPEKFSQLLFDASSRCAEFPPLINAWNEWSEGAAIEPCSYLGNSYLEEISDVFAIDERGNLVSERGTHL